MAKSDGFNLIRSHWPSSSFSVQNRDYSSSGKIKSAVQPAQTFCDLNFTDENLSIHLRFRGKFQLYFLACVLDNIRNSFFIDDKLTVYLEENLWV